MADEAHRKVCWLTALPCSSSAQVHVRVQAEGPTRVLSFHDEGSDEGAEGVQHSVLDLAARLKQLENQLRVVNSQVCAMQGLPKGVLDLYGRHVMVPGAAARAAEQNFSDTASAVSGMKSTASGAASLARGELVRPAVESRSPTPSPGCNAPVAAGRGVVPAPGAALLPLLPRRHAAQRARLALLGHPPRPLGPARGPVAHGRGV